MLRLMYLDVKNNIFTNKVLRGQKATIQVRQIYLKFIKQMCSLFSEFENHQISHG